MADSQVTNSGSIRICRQVPNPLGGFILDEALDHILQEDNVGKILQEESTSSGTIVDASIRIAPTYIRVTQLGRNTLHTEDQALRVTQLGRNTLHTEDQALRVTQLGRNIFHKSFSASEITEDASAQVAVSGEVLDDGSLQVKIHGEQAKLVSARYAATGEITGPASLRVAILNLIQEGFRFRLDDDDENSATWAAAQDTNITAPAGAVRRLRMILDTIGDAPSMQRQLWVRRITPSATPWRKVETE